MPSYNFLNKPADALGNGTDSISMRGFAYGTTNQIAGEALTITTGFRPAYIAVCYGEDAERTMLIYNEDCDNIRYNENHEEVSFGSYFYASNTFPLQQKNPLANTSAATLPEENWRFKIINISDTSFTLKPTSWYMDDGAVDEPAIPTEDCVLWWFALAKFPSKTANTISGIVTNVFDEEIVIDCGFVPDFLVILQSSDYPDEFYEINCAICWNKQRNTTSYLGAGTGMNCNLSYAVNTNLSYPDDSFGPWVDWTDSGFKIYGHDNSFYYFAAKGLPEASE